MLCISRHAVIGIVLLALSVVGATRASCLDQIESVPHLAHLQRARQALLAEMAQPHAKPDCVPAYRDHICNALNASLHGHGSSLLRKGVLAVCPSFISCSSKGVRQEGNMFGNYAEARSVAIAGNMEFVFARQSCSSIAKTHSLQEIAPVIASRPRLHEQASLAAATEAACDTSSSRRIALHVAPNGRRTRYDESWKAYAAGPMPLELREGLRKWVRCRAFGGDSSWLEHGVLAPLDDFALHFRCGDVVCSRCARTGLIHFRALLEAIPQDRNVTLGIVTQPLAAACEAFRSRSRNASQLHVQDGHLANMDGHVGDIAGAFHMIGPGGNGESCTCACTAILGELMAFLRRQRPLARVTIRDGDERLGSEARIALAPLGTFCLGHSTFCMWPAMSAERGSYPFANGDLVIDQDEGFASFADLVAHGTGPSDVCEGVSEADARRWTAGLM